MNIAYFCEKNLVLGFLHFSACFDKPKVMLFLIPSKNGFCTAKHIDCGNFCVSKGLLFYEVHLPLHESSHLLEYV